MFTSILSGLVAALALVCADGRAAPVEYKIVTASERGTYIQIGRDLAKFVVPEADIALDVLPSRGSADNVNRLRYDVGVKLAIVQSDVYQAFLDYASAGNPEAARLLQNFGVLQTEGHPKRREVDRGMPSLGAGWLYYAPMERVLRSCTAPKAEAPATAAARAATPRRCSQQEWGPGLCKGE